MATATTGSDYYPAPQIWMSVGNGRLRRNQSLKNPCAQFLVDFVDFDMWGDYDFDMYSSPRVVSSTEPCLLEWASAVEDQGGWFRSVVKDIRNVLAPLSTTPPASLRSSNIIKAADTNHRSLSSILCSCGRSFDEFRNDADLTVAFDELSKLGLLDRAQQLSRIGLLKQRIAHIEEVEFERAANAGEDEEARVYVEYDQLNNQLADLEADSQALEQRQMVRLWFPLDEDQWDTNMKLPATISTTASSSDSATADPYYLRASPPSDVLPQVLQLRHDGNFSMHAVRTIKYNYLIAFATS